MPAPRFRRKRISRVRRPAVVKLIKKVIKQQAEHKYSNVTANGTITNAVPLEVPLNAIEAGNSAERRIGNDINISHINLRYALFLDDINTKIMVRVYVIQSLNDVDPTNLPSEIIDLMPNLPDSVNNYRILYDKTHQMTLGINANFVRMVRLSGKKMIKTEFRDTGLFDFTKGKIAIHFITDNSTALNVVMGLAARMVFTDV